MQFCTIDEAWGANKNDVADYPIKPVTENFSNEDKEKTVKKIFYAYFLLIFDYPLL